MEWQFLSISVENIMRKLTVFAVFTTLFALLSSACLAGGNLTNQKALQAISMQLKCPSPCQMKVLGVQEIPSQNTAQADIQITDMRFEIPKNDAVTAYAFGPGGGTEVLSTRATAIFGRYNDGRWVLRTIAFPGRGAYDNLNIEVP
jgi:hypothetical protein